jgi:epoxyqueuosine reductase QueG
LGPDASTDEQNYEKLMAFALEQGIDLFGVAAVTSIQGTFHIEPPESVTDLARGISLAARLSSAVMDNLVDRPTLLYKHHYREVNELLDSAALRVASLVQAWGYRALPLPASQILDWRKQIAHVSHKKVAVLAGQGWLGRSNLLVTPQYGARIRLVTVLTDLPLKTDRPLDTDCGKCRACLPVCPAEAIHETQEAFDHRACFEQVRHFAQKENLGYYICGVCVKACRGEKKT